MEVHCNKRTVYIHKTSAVYLLQENERISADHMFRARAKQPFRVSSKPSSQVTEGSSTVPVVCNIWVLCFCMGKRLYYRLENWLSITICELL